jgi:hypothetical protein
LSGCSARCLVTRFSYPPAEPSGGVVEVVSDRGAPQRSGGAPRLYGVQLGLLVFGVLVRVRRCF